MLLHSIVQNCMTSCIIQCNMYTKTQSKQGNTWFLIRWIRQKSTRRRVVLIKLLKPKEHKQCHNIIVIWFWRTAIYSQQQSKKLKYRMTKNSVLETFLKKNKNRHIWYFSQNLTKTAMHIEYSQFLAVFVSKFQKHV